MSVSLCQGAAGGTVTETLAYDVLSDQQTLTATCIDQWGKTYLDTQVWTCGTNGVSGEPYTDGQWNGGGDTWTCSPDAYTAYGACSAQCGGGNQWAQIYDSCGTLTSQGYNGPVCNTQSCCTANAWSAIVTGALPSGLFSVQASTNPAVPTVTGMPPNPYNADWAVGLYNTAWGDLPAGLAPCGSCADSNSAACCSYTYDSCGNATLTAAYVSGNCSGVSNYGDNASLAFLCAPSGGGGGGGEGNGSGSSGTGGSGDGGGNGT
jgi:hypothetical protein